MREAKLFCAMIALLLAGVESKAAAAQIETTYIGNAGFMIKGSGKKLLIDALFDMRPRDPMPSEDVLNRVTRGEEPFDSVDLLLVTHSHFDHFNPKLTVAYLREHKHTMLVAHSDTVAALTKESGFAAIREQVHTVACGSGERRSLKLDGIAIDILCLDHAHPADKRAEMRNLAFIVDLGVGRVLHTGDSKIEQNEATFEDYPFLEKPIAVLFLLHFDRSDVTQRFISERMKPTSMVVMHIPDADRDAVAADVRHVYPGAVIFQSPMEQRSFPVRHP